MNSKKYIFSFFFFTALLFASCNLNNNYGLKGNSENQSSVFKNIRLSTSHQQKIVNDFTKHLNDVDSLTSAVKYLDANIDKLSEENASDMTLLFEIAHTNLYTKLKNNFISTKDNSELVKTYHGEEITLANLPTLQNVELSKSLNDILLSGFTISSSNNIYRPSIDYTFYEKYTEFTSEDIRAYFELLTLETYGSSTEHRGSSFSYEDTFNKAKQCSDFIEKYPNSSRFEVVEYRYSIYMRNLFSNDNIASAYPHSKHLSDDFKLFIDNCDLSDTENEVVKKITHLKTLIENNNYEIDSTVRSFVDDVVSSFNV